MRATYIPFAPSIKYGHVEVYANRFWQKQLANKTKFQRGTMAGKSLGLQRYYLKKASEALKAKRLDDANAWLKAWKDERAYHAHMLGMI